ncbi:MopE-related protein [Flagellimonas zhangzhouensis]|uniref:Por secretion system C-terminal sorting domain-containing protein n=1 Tax=Flagellimonas zhangzhouensis TaxID=1073328 RepID=A0A1H2Q387_9FLAO|nr:MopE-related protein [Allomuricauda zhangzhouensis]SDQ47486.1 Por secretion system C-terminal sorting domain-containing protein [Allomuricauda zhangzhouensis]SDW01571.1 Por secretion system C-terminal sorting domain-containing protein [Allomuricauda zhangzhouensis]
MKPFLIIKKPLLWAALSFVFTQILNAQVPGESYFDNTGFVEYIQGDHPVIITVPHNGYLEPDNIPDRSCNGCKYGSDSHTQEMARTLIDAYFEQTGHYPHVIINLLARVKFDANRPIDEAADGNATVKIAWQNYQDFIIAAKSEIEQDYGRGILFDFHGHSHDVERIELGYTLTKEELALPSEVLNSFDLVDGSGIKTLILDNPLQQTHAQMLTGPFSLGALIQNRGYPTVPSPDDHYPLANEDYFTGGFTIFTHSSRRDNNSSIDGLQIEVNSDIRFDEVLRTDFSIDLADAIFEYLTLFYLSEEVLDDVDQDGDNSNVDCDDNNPNIGPSQTEIPYNGIDDDCNPETLDDDLDQDGFTQENDCDDSNPNINPNQEEIPYNGIDDDCAPETLDDDLDQDGFAQENDCDDTDPNINPNADEILDNLIDENCDGELGTSTIEPPNPVEPTGELIFYPNPTDELLLIINAKALNFYVEFFDTSGKLIYKVANQKKMHLAHLSSGQYIMVYHDLTAGKAVSKKILIK